MYYTSDEKIVSPSDTTVAGEWSVAMMNGEFRDKDAVTLGYTSNPFRGYEPAIVQNDALLRHMMVSAPTGYGKSTFLQNGLRQVAANGDGLCYFSNRDDVQGLVRILPDERLPDVHFVGRLDEETVGYNLLAEASSEDERSVIIHAVVDLLKEARRIQFKPETLELFRRVLDAAMAAETMYTLEDIRDRIANNSLEELGSELPQPTRQRKLAS